MTSVIMEEFAIILMKTVRVLEVGVDLSVRLHKQVTTEKGVLLTQNVSCSNSF